MSASKPLTAKPKRRGRTPGSVNILTLSGILKEMATTHRAMKAGKLDYAKGCKLQWSLTQLRDTVIMARIEPQLLELEEAHQINDARPFGTVARLHS